MTPAPHIPVLLDEVLAALAPRTGDVLIDATFGAGGYTRALLDAGATVHAFDRDPDAIAAGAKWPETEENPPRLVLHPRRFSEMVNALAESGLARVDGIVMDIGVSSMQLDEPGRGFSFMREGPLDMRMAGEGDSAADLVNSLDETELANLLFAYGEERKSRRIAHSIVAARAAQPIRTTTELARLIEAAIGRKPGDMHPATRSFQALRIAVNDEFGQLVEGLFAAERLLTEGGRLAVVTFQSLEDRIVKRFFDPEKGGPTQSRHLPQVAAEASRWVSVSRATKPSAAEIARNPRARSAILRSGHRSAAPARNVNTAGLGVPRFRGAA